MTVVTTKVAPSRQVTTLSLFQIDLTLDYLKILSKLNGCPLTLTAAILIKLEVNLQNLPITSFHSVQETPITLTPE